VRASGDSCLCETVNTTKAATSNTVWVCIRYPNGMIGDALRVAIARVNAVSPQARRRCSLSTSLVKMGVHELAEEFERRRLAAPGHGHQRIVPHALRMGLDL